jgi:hypothetical protein
MLSEEQIELLGDKYLVGLYQDLERDVLQGIARRVRKTERLTETAEIMAKSMRENGYSAAEIYAEVMKKLNATPAYRRMIAENTYAYKQETKQKIAETVKVAKEAGDKLIGEAGEMAFNEDLSMWEQGGVDLKQPNSMKQITDGFKAQAKEGLKNITGTTAFKSPLLGTVKTAEAYQRSLDLALLKVSTGTYSYKQACDDVIKEFTRSGLRTVDYASGRTYQVDTAVRMIVRTSTAQLAGKITEANCKTTGQDLVIISQHMGSRDTHAGFQNKVFSMSGKSKKCPDIHAPLGEGCAYGRPEGLQGPNCTHMFYPFWEGISEIPEPLKEPDPVEYKGRTYTRYEATQQMRAMEREIRALKREKYVARTGGEVEHLNAQIHAARVEYVNFSEAMNLKPKENRLLVGGERSKWAELKKNVPQLQIKKTKEWLDKSIDAAIATLEENQNVTRDELTTLFPPKVKIGINPITGKSVYVLDKDMSYFVNKHVRDGSLRAEDLKNIGYVLDYDIAAKEFDKNGNEIGQMFIKKSPYREGYLDAITKVMDDGEEVFHYQFRSNKHAAKLINKKINSQLVIEDRRSVDVKK